MRVEILKKNPKVYSANVYYVRGNWNAISDINTLIDTGTDSHILEEISAMTSTGVGKRKVEQVILTHEHFDHSGGLKFIKEAFNPKVIAWNILPGVDIKAREGMKLKIGDAEGMIIHAPGHSNDSILVYVESEGVLFAGDTPLSIKTPGGTYLKDYVDVLKRLTRLDIKTVYTGHDPPYTENVMLMLKATLQNVLDSKIIQ